MTIFLHIGTIKTGTTTVQRFCVKNRELLLEKGFLYPKSLMLSDRHVNLAAYAMNENRREAIKQRLRITTPASLKTFRKKMKEDFAKEMEGYKGKFPDILISSEQLSFYLQEEQEVENVRDFLLPYSTGFKVIIYLRRQDHLLLSKYSQDIKQGGTEKIAIPPDEDVKAYFRYDLIIARWAKVFGEENIIIRVYDRNEFLNNDLVHDFLHILGLEYSAEFQPGKDENHSYDAEILEFMRRVNKYMPHMSNSGFNLNKGDFVKLLGKLPQKPTAPYLSPVKLRKFYKSFDECNAVVARKYFKRDNGKLFRENQSSGKEVVKLRRISDERFFEIFAKLWQLKQRRLNAAKQK